MFFVFIQRNPDKQCFIIAPHFFVYPHVATIDTMHCFTECNTYGVRATIESHQDFQEDGRADWKMNLYVSLFLVKKKKTQKKNHQYQFDSLANLADLSQRNPPNVRSRGYECFVQTFKLLNFSFLRKKNLQHFKRFKHPAVRLGRWEAVKAVWCTRDHLPEEGVKRGARMKWCTYNRGVNLDTHVLYTLILLFT